MPGVGHLFNETQTDFAINKWRSTEEPFSWNFLYNFETNSNWGELFRFVQWTVRSWTLWKRKACDLVHFAFFWTFECSGFTGHKVLHSIEARSSELLVFRWLETENARESSLKAEKPKKKRTQENANKGAHVGLNRLDQLIFLIVWPVSNSTKQNWKPLRR